MHRAKDVILSWNAGQGPTCTNVQGLASPQRLAAEGPHRCVRNSSKLERRLKRPVACVGAGAGGLRERSTDEVFIEGVDGQVASDPEPCVEHRHVADKAGAAYRGFNYWKATHGVGRIMGGLPPEEVPGKREPKSLVRLHGQRGLHVVEVGDTDGAAHA